ncbi:MAG: hypothetical protein H6741_07230 [Alphaproteobacteria bacterium]|nr:hypothetical protein [Alphaproteobacteria bacterium]
MFSLLLALSLTSPASAGSLKDRAESLLAPAPEARIKKSTQYPSQAPSAVAAEDIQVFALGELPDGAYKTDTSFGVTVRLTEDYPSAEAPHLDLGVVSVRRESHSEERLMSAALEVAGRHGANAVVVLTEPTHSELRVQALRLSDAEAAPEARPPADELLTQAGAELEGYARSATTFERRLEQWEPITFEGKRGTCYGLALALEPDADFERAAKGRKAIHLPYSYTGQSYTTNSSWFGPKDSGAKRAHAARVSCPEKSGPVTVDMIVPGADGAPLGEGTLRAVLYTKSISEAELVKRAADREAGMAESRAAGEAARAAEETRRAEREAEAAAQRSAAAKASAETPTTSASQHFSLSLKSECPSTVKVIEAMGSGSPPNVNGTRSRVTSNSIESYSGNAPWTLWLVNDSEQPLGSWTATPGSHSMKITSSCTAIVPR